MTNYAIFAKNPQRVPELKAIAEMRGFTYDPEFPQFMITIGGDGTFLLAEHRYPGIPKLLVRDSLICYKCHNEPIDEMLRIIAEGRYLIKEILKLRAAFNASGPLAANDIIIRNTDPRHALRFRLTIDATSEDDILIGDGVVVATPFGSTGYFRSITRQSFFEGIGLGFNN
ncbi:MAG: hypothetical protein GF344_17065, partial [Chitinivibrionales bacterium]|nr:hypothetical protein [Chitinivibrionales bacterium]